MKVVVLVYGNCATVFKLKGEEASKVGSFVEITTEVALKVIHEGAAAPVASCIV